MDEPRGDDRVERSRRRSRSSAAVWSACEMAQAFASLGSSVTLVEAGERLIAGEEEFASRAGRRRAAASAGIVVHSASRRRGSPRAAKASSSTSTAAGTITSDELLVATGRRPLTADLGLETRRPRAERAIEVDDDMRRPGHDWLYAVGDVNGRALLTHIGKQQARAVADRLAGRASPLRHDSHPPRVIFTEPQVAAVGHTLRSAARGGAERHRGRPSAGRDRGRQLRRPWRSRTIPPRRRRRSPSCRRCDVHRPRCRRPAARGDDRGRRRRWHSTISGTACRRSRPAAKCGCGCSSGTGCSAGTSR